ncbi:MAG: anaerobic ribonucleoside-triphosphate reductase activating protein [Actinomycetota bacterium]|nr:anaerobic ribonucleoside-triphosphate reductase activating protein [Actinomycetota bacterium]
MGKNQTSLKDKALSAFDVKGYIPNTMLDWEGMLAATIFLPGCNFRCPYCQNPDLVLRWHELKSVPFELIQKHLSSHDGWIEGVCITGGEPCIHKDLPELCARIKDIKLGVKLDTNGSSPGMLERLIRDSLIDYVAMDVKAPLDPESYQKAIGIEDDDIVERILQSIELLKGSPIEHEFRTTVVPKIHGTAEVESIAASLAGEEKYYIQNFSSTKTLDDGFSNLKPFTEEDMDMMLERARTHIPGAKKRGTSSGMEHL